MSVSLNELVSLDKRHSLVKGSADVVVRRPCSPQGPISDGLFLVKDEKRWKEFVALESKPQNISLMIDANFWSSLEKDESEKDLFKSIENIFTTTNFDLSLALISRPFYLEQTKNLNSSLDGRQSGQAEIHPSAIIGRNCFIGEGVSIGKDVILHPNVIIEGPSKIGDGTEIFSNVSIYPFTQIGQNCRIHSNIAIGTDGFGYHFEAGIHEKIWHFGGVEIGDHVELGPGTCVDGGSFSPTRIGSGTKVDNLVQIAHNCQIGKGVILCGQSGLSGSASLGDFTVVGGKAGIGPGVKVGKASQIAGNAMVTTSWPEGSVLGGHPARPLKEWMRYQAKLKRLVEKEDRKKSES